MRDRQFNETDLREMLACASDYYPNHEPGRWVIVTHHDGHDWEVIVEPETSESLLLVVTAYPVTV